MSDDAEQLMRQTDQDDYARRAGETAREFYRSVISGDQPMADSSAALITAAWMSTWGRTNEIKMTMREEEEPTA